MVSPSRNELIKNLIDYIEKATGLDRDLIIRGNQNAPSPTGTYCSLLYVTDTGDGLLDSETTAIEGNDEQVLYNMRFKRFYLFSIQFYRAGATDLAKSLMIYHETPAGQEFSETSLFTVRKVDNIREAAITLSNNYEERASLNLEIILNEKETQTLDKIATAIIDINVDNISETIEVE